MFEKLYDECLALLVRAGMQDEEETRKELCELINKISEACVKEQITEDENNILVDLLK